MATKRKAVAETKKKEDNKSNATPTKKHKTGAPNQNAEKKRSTEVNEKAKKRYVQFVVRILLRCTSIMTNQQ